MKGSISARVVAPPRPGSSPTQKPMPMPASMKANAFHCSTATRPARKASAMPGLLAEFHVLAELADDVLRLAEHLAQHLEGFVAGGVFQVELRLLALGEERRILERRLERGAHHL